MKMRSFPINHMNSIEMDRKVGDVQIVKSLLKRDDLYLVILAYHKTLFESYIHLYDMR